MTSEDHRMDGTATVTFNPQHPTGCLPHPYHSFTQQLHPGSPLSAGTSPDAEDTAGETNTLKVSELTIVSGLGTLENSALLLSVYQGVPGRLPASGWSVWEDGRHYPLCWGSRGNKKAEEG
jgi:hypothetical protein